jgi:anti-sigma factor RsiW
MTCEKYKGVIIDLAAGELDPAAERGLREHLASCPSCRRDLEETQALVRDARAAFDVQAPVFAVKRSTRFRVPLWGAAAAVFIAALASGYMGFVAGGARAGEVIRPITVVAKSADGFWSLRQKAPATAAERKSQPRNCEFWDYRAALEKMRRGARG